MSVHQDRRDATYQRIPFDALVELGGSSESPAFEAQGVDVSPKGMHLRTAYLPDIGQPLVCRFDGHGQEIMTDAEVVWRKDEDRGGAFGIRFTNVDPHCESALRRMCGVDNANPNGASPAGPDVDPGTRVRLHIDGLGSPMKARVRGASDGEMLVGSNLEFLRVGRALELEDMDHGSRRPARIDRVDVEVDRQSKVPQLIVTLRYDEENGSEEQPNDSYAASEVASPASASPEPSSARASMRSSHSESPSDVAGEAADQDLDSDRKPGSGWPGAQSSWGPAFSRWGTQAKTTLSLLWAKAFERSGAAASALRRTTSPPPAGALHASGKRVVRSGSSPEVEVPTKRLPSKKKMLALGGASGLAVVVAAASLAKPSAEPPLAAAGAPSGSAASAAAPSEPVIAAEPLTANVPLFGPTAIGNSASAQATSPGAGALPAGAPVAPGALSANGAQAANVAFAQGMIVPGSQPSKAAAGADDDAAGRDDGDAHKKVPAFLHGKVTHPITFQLKTDGTITALHGARTPTGFTVALPGRKAMESLQALASRDRRIAAVHVNNGTKGTEISVQFKDGVPPYAIRAKGADVQIALGRADDTDRTDRAENSTRSEHSDRFDRNDRADRSDRSERSDRGERADRSDRDRGGDRTDRYERTDRNDRGDRAERADRSDHTTDRSDRYDRPERTERADRSERADRDERADRSDRDRGDRDDRAARDRDDNRDRDRGLSDRAGGRSSSDRSTVAKKSSVHERQRGTRDSD